MDNNIQLGFIYGMQNPNTGEIFYIGATRKSLSQRLNSHYQHLNEVKKGIRNTNKRFEYLKSLNKKPNMLLLELCTNNELFQREKIWIENFKNINPNLTNEALYFDPCFYKTKEEKKLISKKLSNKLKGKPKPAGFSDNLSKMRRGHGNPAAKEMKHWIVADSKFLFKFGFEINEFCNSKYAYGNIYRGLVSKKSKTKNTVNSYGHTFILFSNLNKEIQDIVQSGYESNQ